MTKQPLMHLRCSGAARRQINRLIAATRADEMKGSFRPEDADEAEQEFGKAKTSLEQFIARLEQRVQK